MFNVSKMTDYSFLVLSLFLFNNKEEKFSALEISKKVNLPLPTVTYILKKLTSGGLLSSIRGAKGGYILNRVAKEISLYDVMLCIDGEVYIAECVDGSDNECSTLNSCFLRGNWNTVNDKIIELLKEITAIEMCLPKL